MAYLGLVEIWDAPAGKSVRDAADRLGVALFHAAYSGTDVQSASATIEKEAADAIYVPLSTSSYVNARRIADLASARRLPCIGPFKETVQFGCLSSRK